MKFLFKIPPYIVWKSVRTAFDTYVDVRSEDWSE